MDGKSEGETRRLGRLRRWLWKPVAGTRIVEGLPTDVFVVSGRAGVERELKPFDAMKNEQTANNSALG